jgi:hypothetical protein
MLNEREAFYTRVVDDGRVIDVVPLTFGRARIVISKDINDIGWFAGF